MSRGEIIAVSAIVCAVLLVVLVLGIFVGETLG